MGNEQVRQPEVALQVLHQVDDLRLDADVERADGLVADDEFRVHGQGAGDADALALAAGELVRVAVRRVRVEPTSSSSSRHARFAALPLAAGEVDPAAARPRCRPPSFAAFRLA